MNESSGDRARPALMAAAGCGLALWSVLDPRFRDAEGVLTGRACLPMALAAAFWIGAAMRRGVLAPAAAWMTLLVVGSGISLQLIEAGTPIRYQHYILPNRAPSPWYSVMLTGLLIQAGLVMYGLAGRWRTIGSWLRRTFGIAGLLMVAAVVVASSAAPSRERASYLFEMLFATAIQAINLGNLVLVAAAIPAAGMERLRAFSEQLFGRDGPSEPGGVDRFALATAAFVTLGAAALAYWSYEGHPHIPDEVVYLLHARYFADGRLSVPLPPVSDAFHLALLYYDPNRAYSPVPPGWPAILALGVLGGAPWLVNPILAGINTLLAYAAVREFDSRRTARMVIVLMALSPWQLMMAMNFMTHTFTLTCVLAAALGVGRARRTGSVVWSLGAGAAIGMLSLVRPLEGLIAATVFGLWAIAGRSRMRIPAILALIVGTGAIGAIALPYNKYMTGDPMWFPIMKYNDEYFGKNSNAFGFGADRGGSMNWPLDPYPGHGPADAAVNTLLNMSTLNTELFGWSTGSVLLLALFVVSGRVQRRDLAMLACVALVIGIHAFYWYSGGPGFGPRYWFLALVPLLVLGRRAIAELDRLAGAGDTGGLGGRVTAAVAALSLTAAVVYMPWRAIDKYHHFQGMRADVQTLAARHDFGRSLALIRGREYPDYASAAVYNPLDLRAPVPVYARDLNARSRAEVVDAYADRPIWIVNGPSVTGRGFEIVAGPLTADEVKRMSR